MILFKGSHAYAFNGFFGRISRINFVVRVFLLNIERVSSFDDFGDNSEEILMLSRSEIFRLII